MGPRRARPLTGCEAAKVKSSGDGRNVTSEILGVPGMEGFCDVGPVEEFVRDMVGGVRILRPNLSKRLGADRDAPAGAEAGALRWSLGWLGFVGRVLFALSNALADFESWK